MRCLDPGGWHSGAVSTTTGARIWAPLLTLWLVWGSTYFGIAIQGRWMPPLLASGVRLALAGVVLALLARLTGASLRITRTQLRGTATLGIGLMSVGIGTLALAERYVPSGVAALIVSSVPLWIVVFRAVSGQRMSRVTIAGVVVGLVGLALMVLPGGSHAVAGTELDVVLWSLAICASSFVWSLFSFRSRRYDLPANSLVSAAYELMIGGGVLVVVGLILGDRVHTGDYPPSAYAAWGYLILASVIGYGCYTYLLAKAPLSLVSTYAYVNPIVAVILALLILQEPITRAVVIGLTIVVGGVVLVVSGERRAP